MLLVGGSSNVRGNSQAVFMFVLLVLMKKSTIVALGIAAIFFSPSGALLLLFPYYHTFMYPYLFLLCISSVPHEIYISPFQW